MSDQGVLLDLSQNASVPKPEPEVAQRPSHTRLQDTNTAFNNLQRAMQNESDAIDIGTGEYETMVALFVYSGAHSTPPQEDAPISQIMQSSDRAAWVVFDASSTEQTIGDASAEQPTAKDCKEPLIDFDGQNEQFCHRRVAQSDIGEAIYLALWLAAQTIDQSTSSVISAFVTSYRMHSDGETSDINVLESVSIDAQRLLENSFDDAQESETLSTAQRDSKKPFVKTSSPIPQPSSRAWIFWLVGALVLIFVAAIVTFFVLQKRKSSSAAEPSHRSLSEKPPRSSSDKHLETFANSKSEEEIAKPVVMSNF